METLLTATLTHGDYGLTVTDATGNQMKNDLPISQGGMGNGMRPMQTMLAALCACSSVDIVSVLKKQKQLYTNFEMKISGEREANVEPSVWQKVHIIFEMEGNVQLEKLQRAAELSITKYCSVAETLRRAGATITFETIVKP